MDAISETLRALSPLEHHSSAQHFLSLHHNHALTALYTLPSTLLSRIRIFSAVKAVIQQHAPLGVTILGEGTSEPRFARLKVVDLDSVVHFGTLEDGEDGDDALNKVLSSQHSLGFVGLGTLPAWRLLVLHTQRAVKTWISFIYHPSLCDPASAGMFHKSLTQALQSSVSTTPTDFPASRHVVRPPVAAAFPESLDELVPRSMLQQQQVGVKVFVEKVLGYVFPPPSLHHQHQHHLHPLRRPPPPPPPPPTNGNGKKTVFSSITLPKATTRRLLAACARENTSVTSLILAVILRAILPSSPEAPITSGVTTDARETVEKISLRGSTTFAKYDWLKTRTHAPGEDEHFVGNVFAHAHSLSPSRSSSSSSSPLSSVAGNVPDLRPAPTPTVVLTHAGTLDAEGIERSVFSQSADAQGSPRWCLARAKRGLVVGVAVPAGGCAEREVARVLEGVGRGIEELV